MSPRRRRMLTSDEVALWTHVTRHIAPIAPAKRARTKPGPVTAAPEADPPPPAPALPAPPAAPPVPPPPGKFRKPAWKKPGPEPTVAGTPGLPAPPPLAPLERRLRQRLSRGSHPIEAVIDLHGLRQDEAHGALRGFLLSAQRQGHAVVLVVTGKGGAASAGGSLFEERGVLRRTVPHWLRLPDLRSVVVGFEEAAQHHGGGGALYVRIRRVRNQAP